MITVFHDGDSDVYGMSMKTVVSAIGMLKKRDMLAVV